jgi:hypothetical protein
LLDILFSNEWWIEITDISISDICQYKECNEKIVKEAMLTLRADGNEGDEFEQTLLVCDKHFQIIKAWWLSLKK